jgi:hypothetical protein
LFAMQFVWWIWSCLRLCIIWFDINFKSIGSDSWRFLMSIRSWIDHGIGIVIEGEYFFDSANFIKWISISVSAIKLILLNCWAVKKSAVFLLNIWLMCQWLKQVHFGY